MNFEQQIQHWIIMDKEQHLLNEKIKQLRDRKTKLSQQILYYAREKNIDSFKLGSEKIKFAISNVYQPITLKYLDTCLKNIIKNEDQVSKIIDYIKSKRDVKTSFEIKRLDDK